MKQIVDKLNKIAKAIDENVDIPESNLITDSLDAITTALGGTPNDSSLIVDKLEDIAGVATGGGGGESLFKICNLQINAGNYSVELTAPLYSEIPSELGIGEGYFLNSLTSNLDSGIYKIVVPKSSFCVASILPPTAAVVITTTGDIQMFQEGLYMITGDCTVIASNPK